MMMRTSRAIALAFCTFVAACGGSSSGIDESTARLVLEPATSEHIIMNGVSPTQAFTATLVDASGHAKDVTDDVTWSVDQVFGEFAGPTLTIKTPGKQTVSALYTDKLGSAQVLARAKITRVADGTPADAPDLFTGGTEDATKAPTIVYPAEGVTMPRNIGDFEAHWTDPVNDVFEVSLQSELADIRVYVVGNNGVGGGPRPSWFAFTPTEWMYAASGESTVNYQVRGASTASPGTIGSAPARIVKLTNEPMEGGVYYWAAAGAEYGIFRHDVAKPGEPEEPFMTDVSTGKCVACHALSRDGTTMAITYDGGNGRATIVDVATKTAQPVPAPLPAGPGVDIFSSDDSRWNFASLYPDGSRMLTVFDGVLTVRQTSDQVALATMPSAGGVSHPDLAGDLSKLVYTRKPVGGADWSFTGGSIFTRTYDAATLTFGPEVPLVADGQQYFYPSFSPDGQWVMFNKAAAGTDSYNNVDATLWVVKADGSAPPVQLTAFNAAAGGLTNSWGRWAPFQQTVGAGNEPIYWVTTSSKRDFGVRRINSGQPEGAKTPQIWMAPFYTSRATAGTDPSGPAFRLPFQNLMSNNHIAQWTERVIEVQ